MAALAQWCFRRRWIVVGIWLGLLVAFGGLTQAFGTNYNDQFKLPGTESTKALKLLTTALPAQAGDSDTIVVHVPSGSVHDPAVKARVSRMLTKVESLPSVDSVISPYADQGASQISTDGRTAYATVAFDKQADVLPLDHIQNVLDTAQAAKTSGLEVAMGGQAIERLTPPATSSSELVGFVAAAIILFITFGSFLPMLLPLVVAVAALGCGILSIGLLSHAITLGSIAPTLATLIGLGVGIDYALFVVTRHRTGLRAGLTPEQAAVRSLNTSGRAVMFAGGTVCVALLGLLVLRVSFLSGMGIGASITVLWTVAAAVTLLPAMLGFLGPKALGKKERRALAADGPQETHAVGGWARWAALVERRKALLSTVALLVVLALSMPVLALRLGSSDAGNNAKGTTTRTAYDLLAQGFGPGFNGPLQLVAELPSSDDPAALQRLATEVGKHKDVAAVVTLPSKPGATVGIVSVIPKSAPQDEATTQLINDLRKDVIPAAAKGTTMKVYVGGATAIFADFAQVLTDKLPLFLGVIVASRLPAAPCRLPQHRHPTHRRRDERPGSAGRVRGGDGDLPVGLGREPARNRTRGAGRRVRTGHHVGDPLRAVDGLSGLPRQPDARGMGAHPRQRPVGASRPGRHRTRHHSSRDDHDLRLRVVRVRRATGHRGVRYRAGGRSGDRRVHLAHRPRAGAHARVRARQLVAARVAGPDPPAHVRGACG